MTQNNYVFLIGIIMLIMALAVDTYIFLALVRPEVEIGLIGDIPWITIVLGIILTSLAYLKKSS